MSNIFRKFYEVIKEIVYKFFILDKFKVCNLIKGIIK